MGGGKLLLPWEGMPIVAHVVQNALGMQGNIPVFVVTGYEAADVQTAIMSNLETPRNVHVLENQDWQKGQSTSLRFGIRAIAEKMERPRLKGVVVMLGDQPLVQPQTLDFLAAAHCSGSDVFPSHLATAPTYEGRRGNPVILSPKLFPGVMKLRGDTGARGILARLGERLRLVPVDDAGIIRDIDSRDDYKALCSGS